MRRVLSVAFVLLSMRLCAQVEGVPHDLIEQRIEAAVEIYGGENEVDLSTLFEVLTDRFNDPIDLNHTDAQELHSLLLLTDPQINAIMQHIIRNGPLLSIYELQAIDGMDLRSIEMIRPFVTVREHPLAMHASLRDMLKRGEQELLLRSTMNVQQRRGFQHRSDNWGTSYSDQAIGPTEIGEMERNSQLYLGSPYRIYTRYRFRYRHNLSFGITAEKDEGEEFFRGSQPNGFDFYSAHLFLRDIGRWKAIAIGDHAAQFGQGLAFWNGLAFASKSSFAMNVKRNAIGLLPYTSVNENLFMRGVGGTYALSRKWEITASISSKPIDASVQPGAADTIGTAPPEVLFSSFQQDGYHRTYNELAKKDAVQEHIGVAHLRYRDRTFSIGATASHVRFDADLQRNVRPYNQFEFNGDRNSTAGIDMDLLYRNANFFGEAAMSANGGLAYNAGVLLSLDRRVDISVVHRDYGRDFQSLYSTAFGEGSKVSNERGTFLGLAIQASRAISINAYIDRFRFPWLRYQIDAPSHGTDWLVQLNWRPRKHVDLYVRTRHRYGSRNTGETVTGVRPVVRTAQINHRFHASYRVTPAITFRTRLETVTFQRGDLSMQHGFMLYHDLVHRPMMGPIEVTLRFALFETDGWDARLYAYENDLAGMFSIPAYSGRGIRWYGMLRARPFRNVDVWLRYGAFILPDQERIGSGLQEVRGNVRSDLKLQVRLRF